MQERLWKTHGGMEREEGKGNLHSGVCVCCDEGPVVSPVFCLFVKTSEEPRWIRPRAHPVQLPGSHSDPPDDASGRRQFLASCYHSIPCTCNSEAA